MSKQIILWLVASSLVTCSLYIIFNSIIFMNSYMYVCKYITWFIITILCLLSINFVGFLKVFNKLLKKLVHLLIRYFSVNFFIFKFSWSNFTSSILCICSNKICIKLVLNHWSTTLQKNVKAKFIRIKLKAMYESYNIH